MSPLVADKALALLYGNAQERKRRGEKDVNVNVTFFGGEPLLNFGLIEHIFTRVTAYHFEKTKIPLVATIITNGTIINKDIVEAIQKFSKEVHPVGIQLSVDGIKESHDFYRKTRDGKGSFDTIAANIPMFKSIFGGEGFSGTPSRERLNVHGSLNKMTVRTMYESWKFFNDVWGIPAIWFMPVHSEDWSDEDAAIYDQQLSLIANDLLQRAVREHNSQIIADFAPLNKCLGQPKGDISKPCGAGDSYISITANGAIYPCHQFYYLDKSLWIGHVDTGIEDERRALYLYYDSTDMNCSRAPISCPHTGCYRCIAENYAATGSILNCKIDARCRMSASETRIRGVIRQVLKENNLPCE